jgi:hypothetical protein
MEITPVSVHELQATVAVLKDKVEDIIARIEGLQEKR